MPVEQLREGETLAGIRGPVRLQTVEDLGQTVEVCIMEVEGDHCYRVGEQGVLVHNASAHGPTPLTLTASQMTELQSVAQYRANLVLPAAGTIDPKTKKTELHTIVKLEIAGQTIWGINSGTGGLPQAKLDENNELAKCCNPTGKGALKATTQHAEADTVFQAFDKRIMSATAVMYCDRPLCGFCKDTLANLICLAGIKTLTWIGPNDTRTGYVTYTFNGP